MAHNVMLVPTYKTSGIYTVSLGLVKALNDNGVKAALFSPFYNPTNSCTKDRLCKFCAAKQIAKGNKSEVLERIVADFNDLTKGKDYDVVIIEGVCDAPFDTDIINADICHAFDADIITLTTGVCECAKNAIDATLNFFGNAGKKKVLGSILLNHKAPKDASGNKKLVLSGCGKCQCSDGSCSVKEPVLKDFIATVDYDKKFYSLNANEVASILKSEVTGDTDVELFKVTFRAQNAKEGQILITEDADVTTNASLTIICSGVDGKSNSKAIIRTDKSALAVVQALSSAVACVNYDKKEQISYIENTVAKAFNSKAIELIKTYDKNALPLMSPAAFRYKLTELARAANKKIALPEGDEPRTVAAAAAVAKQGIATPVLFGKKETILEVAKQQGVTLNERVEFVDPDEVRENYVARLVELRKSKGMTEQMALDMLKDNVALATMMIERNELDGLVSGAVHTTANTIRPPLQIIKTAPNAKLVSAIFFMLMDEQVYIYGDCALNINPDAEQISEIAIQSADTAKAFGIDPRVAMVTYSTMNSGKGADVDLMREATELVRQKRPDILVDGPLQYDAAVMENVAKQKAPNSPVAGKATVFIFPSLSTGNTVYKAVQRSANLVSIGPMLQGMKKPVNDLSRGALVDDIIYTIAVTAIQATQA